jgi:hypothetical protein
MKRAVVLALLTVTLLTGCSMALHVWPYIPGAVEHSNRAVDP